MVCLAECIIGPCIVCLQPNTVAELGSSPNMHVDYTRMVYEIRC
jgi:hypothetical protein